MADMTARQRAMEWLEWAADNPDEITGPLNMKVLQKLEAEFAAHAESQLARLVTASGMDVEGLAIELIQAWDPGAYGAGYSRERKIEMLGEDDRSLARRVAALIGVQREHAFSDGYTASELTTYAKVEQARMEERERAAQLAESAAEDIADGTADTFSGGYKSASVHIAHDIRAADLAPQEGSDGIGD